MSARLPELLACDLDGTLIDEAGRPHAGVPEALASLVAVGVPLAVCSGRPLYAAQHRSERLGAVPRAFICYHGALVVDTATDAWLQHLTVPQPRVLAVTADALEAGLSVTLYIGDERVELPAEPKRIPALPGPVTRIILTGEPAVLDDALPSLRRRWGEGLRVERAHPSVIDVLDGRADKGAALALLAAHLQISLAGVVACGDSRSDVSLLRAAGNAVAVGDAPDQLRRVAKTVVAPDHLAAFLLSLLR